MNTSKILTSILKLANDKITSNAFQENIVLAKPFPEPEVFPFQI